MTLYLLCHEFCDDDGNKCSFDSPLTSNGLTNAFRLIPYLCSMNIDQVYSSPFIRCLQTVGPFVLQNRLKINVEYALSELMSLNDKTTWARELTCVEMNNNNVNTRYGSIYQFTDFQYPETPDCGTARINSFMNMIEHSAAVDKKTILVCSHPKIINAIIKRYYPEKKYDDLFPVGGIMKINLTRSCL